MSNYRANPSCRCARCRLAGMMAPAVLITLGFLFLIDNLGWRGFHDTWPLLLIVIGIIKVLQYTAPIEAHIPAGTMPVAPPPVANYGEVPPPPDVQPGPGNNEGVQNG